MYLSKSRSTLRIALTAALLGGCTESAPLGVAPSAPIAPPAFVRGPSADAVSIVDNGETFTLDTIQQRLYAPNGDNVLLDQEQTVMLLQAMRGVEVTDSDADQLEQAYFDRNGQCTINNDCVEPQSFPRLEPAPELIIRRRGVITLPGESEGRRFLVGKRNRRSGGDVSTLTTDLCTQTVEDAVYRIQNWRDNRGGLFRQVFEWAAVTLVGTTYEKVIPGASLTGFYDAVAQHYYHQQFVNGLSWLWYSHSCNTRDYWVDASRDNSSATGGSGSNNRIGTDYQLSCQWELWEISFDGGKTFHPVNVNVCKYIYVK